MPGPPGERAQSTVEMALLLPVLVLLLLFVAQAAVLARDRVQLTRATSAAARAAMVQPDRSAADAALGDVAAGLDVQELLLTGPRQPGSVLTVRVVARPTRLPLVGLALSSMRMTESLAVRVEG